MNEILDDEIISEAKDMMKSKFPTMISYFLEDSTMYVTQVEEAFAANDVEALVPPAHTLKSSSRQMGAILLSDIAKDIELAAREVAKGNNSINEIKTKISELKDALEKTHEAYKDYQ